MADAVLGLLADPGLPSELANDVAEQLSDPLARDTDGRARWRVETATQCCASFAMTTKATLAMRTGVGAFGRAWWS
jgi:hypothetical protein